MPNPFQDFIQLELPKRPFLENDAPQETVFIRRGQAPREMAAISLNNGQVLGKVNGVLQGVIASEGINFEQETAQQTWTVEHNKNNTKCLVQLYDTSGDLIVADNIRVEPDIITVSFSTAQSGRASIIFY